MGKQERKAAMVFEAMLREPEQCTLCDRESRSTRVRKFSHLNSRVGLTAGKYCDDCCDSSGEFN